VQISAAGGIPDMTITSGIIGALATGTASFSGDMRYLMIFDRATYDAEVSSLSSLLGANSICQYVSIGATSPFLHHILIMEAE
jgi:hypothetical protein